MRNRITQLEEKNRGKQQTLTSEEYDKIRNLEESLIRATLEKVSFWSTGQTNTLRLTITVKQAIKHFKLSHLL